jgi:hypothetical protein
MEWIAIGAGVLIMWTIALIAARAVFRAQRSRFPKDTEEDRLKLAAQRAELHESTSGPRNP